MPAQIFLNLTTTIACILIGISANICWAQSVTAFDVALPVKEIATLDAEQVEITIDESSSARIVTRQQLPLIVAARYATRPELLRRLSVPERLKILKALLAVQAAHELRGTVVTFLKVADVEDLQTREAFFELSRNDRFLSALKETLIAPSIATTLSLPLRAFAAAVTAAVDPEWARGQISPLIFDQAVEVQKQAQAIVVHALEQRDLVTVKNIGTFLQIALGMDGLQGNSIVGLANQLEKIRIALAETQLDALVSLTTTFPLADPVLERKTRQMIVSMANERAQVLLSEGKTPEVLKILSRVDLRERTPRTHDLVIEAIGGLEDDYLTVFDDEHVQYFLPQLAAADAGIKRHLLKKLEYRFQLELARQPDAAHRNLPHLLLSVRPDPDGANDSLRVKQIVLLTERGMNSAAQQTYARIKNSLTLRDKVSLFRSGYYLGLLEILGLAALLVLLYLFARMRRIEWEESRLAELMQRVLSSKKTQPKNTTQPNSEAEQPRFVNPGARKSNQVLVEYRELLRVLGLETTASSQEVKRAYRNAVKKIHPDLRHEVSSESSTDFIRLTEVYDRVLQLRELLGLSNKNES